MNRELSVMEKMERELNLKRLQIRSLSNITQAINDNISQEGLFRMYNTFLSWEMGIKKMALYINTDGVWMCSSVINFDAEKFPGISDYFDSIKRLHTIKNSTHPGIKQFDIIIPVFHKDQPIAYALIGGIQDKEDMFNQIEFITTITNIIAVAIENKRLFKRQIEQERYRRELELAKEVQSLLIPEDLPNNTKYCLSKIYQPHYNIGGDYLDFIKFDDDRFAFCIADISGKGVAAALLMANFQAMIQGLIFQYRDLETFVFALNQSVYRITKGDRFITFFVGEVDIKKRKLRYINAGHFPPLLKSGDNPAIKLEKGCTVIGAFDNLPQIEEGAADLMNETIILCFTDGLSDLKNQQNQYFEEEKIFDFLNKNKHLTPIEFNQRLMTEIDRFKEDRPISDDIAVLTCKIF